MYKKYCPLCKVDRVIDIADVYSKGKKRVVCGHCGSVLLKSQQEIENLYWQIYGCDS